MKRVSSRRVLKASKARAARTYSIVSFSLDNEAVRVFKRACDRQQVKASVVIEEFMKEFAKVNK
jgi:hypothetical protein